MVEMLSIVSNLLAEISNEEAFTAMVDKDTTLAEDVYVFPSSAAQQRFWLLDQLQPGNPALNVPFTWRFQGILDISALHRSLNEIVCRHESLRTTFVVQEGQLMQVIAPEMELPLPLVDL